VEARIWWATPSRLRWRIGKWYASDRHDWCQIVDAIFTADDPARRADYDDWCDVPLLTDAGPIRPGWCYCTPKEMAA
jgi:hypothetical protein